MISVIAGYFQIYIVHRFSSISHKNHSLSRKLYRDMILIGLCRSITIVLGLLALKSIAVSFVATIKSSSPLFTVIISRVMLGERTSQLNNERKKTMIFLYQKTISNSDSLTKLSMIPITIGLTLCCSFELSFHFIGFLCALGTNVFEWYVFDHSTNFSFLVVLFIFSLQNVYSKILISGENYRYTAIELQFWASFLACFLQLPLLFYNVDVAGALNLTSNSLLTLYILNGFAYHIQSVAAYAIMAYISPITHRSVVFVEYLDLESYRSLIV